jgi:hypothetical protein
VKNTADPVMNVPSPSANRSDCTESRPARGDGGRAWRSRAVNITEDCPAPVAGCRAIYGSAEVAFTTWRPLAF